MVTRATGAALGAVADRLLGEPTRVPHPVALFGTAMGHVERATYGPTRGRGLAYAVVGLGLGAGAGAAVRSVVLATYVAVAGRQLGDTALDIEGVLRRDGLVAARAALPSLVGRDPSELGEDEVVRAVVESVAENTVDAVIAPMVWAAVGGAPAVLGYRAVNTMDAMVGHRSPRYEHYGTAAARLDDVANWIPARVTAVLVVLARPRSAAAVLRAVAQDAPAHPSPNAGVAEAAFAAALGVELGGTNRYGDRVEERPRLGRGRAPATGDVAAAVRLSHDVTAVLAALLAAPAALRWGRTRLASRGGAR